MLPQALPGPITRDLEPLFTVQLAANTLSCLVGA